MSLQVQINDHIKDAMRAKEVLKLEALRAVKAEILKALTETGAQAELSAGEEIKLLQRMVKQRKESAAIFTQQGREDLAQPELDQAAIIEVYLPAQLTEEQVKAAVEAIVAENNLAGMANMGKVMGLASAKLAGQVDGKTLSSVVKAVLS